jgi:2'-5' RNA ligase
MARRDIGVAIGLPEPYTSELQGWRERLGDPNAADIPPHVTLLPPTELRTDDLVEVEEHLQAVAQRHAPFTMHLRGSGTFRPISPVVFVPLVQGIGECERLEAHVRSGALARDV